MRRVLISVALVAVLVALPTAALAGTNVDGRGNTITGSDAGQSGSSASGGGTSGALPPGMMTVQVPTLVGPGQYCIITIVVPVGTVLPPYNPVSTMTQVPCPGGVALPPPSASQIAQAWVQSAHLPAPTLFIAPGHAVTGLTAFLQITAHSPWSATFNDPIRNDTITASCAYTGFDIDWGDGTRTSTPDTGGPYPDGNVTHVYEDASPGLAVAVTEHWSCSWSDQVGDSGTIAGLSSAGTLPLEVREIQTPTA